MKIKSDNSKVYRKKTRRRRRACIHKHIQQQLQHKNSILSFIIVNTLIMIVFPSCRNGTTRSRICTSYAFINNGRHKVNYHSRHKNSCLMKCCWRSISNNNSRCICSSCNSGNISKDYFTKVFKNNNNHLKSIYNVNIQQSNRNHHHHTKLFSSFNSNYNNDNDNLNKKNKGDENDKEEITMYNNKDLFLNEIESFLYHEIFTKMSTLQTSNNQLKSQSNNIHILLAVSGGCDSIALFHAMLQIMKKKWNHDNDYDSIRIFDYKNNGMKNNIIMKCNIHVVHFDHQQRDKESDGDRLFVQNLCHLNHVPFHCFYWNEYYNEYIENENHTIDNDDNKEIEKRRKKLVFSQESARNWRRQKSIELLKDIVNSASSSSSSSSSDCSKVGVILTAHHKDDAEETMIMKFLRGVHLTNWSGMDPLQSIDNSVDVSNLKLYFGKPMLCVRKKAIQDFLKNQRLDWRDDESNQTDKYLRNRVRHHLMPLLQDLVGGEDALAARLKNIEDQSLKLQNDISSRAQEYLTGTKSQFPLTIQHHGEVHTFGLVQEEALYMWIRKESECTINVSYEKLSMIKQQILNFPQRRQWKLSIGDNWYIKRNGDILELELQNDSNLTEDTEHGNTWIIDQSDIQNHSPMNEEENIMLSFSFKERINGSLKYSLRKVQGNEKMIFVPPWRQEDSKGVKIKEFLRGQKVPLHRRDTTSIICIDTGKDINVGAVYVENGDKGKWIVNGIFASGQDEMHVENVLIKRCEPKS